MNRTIVTLGILVLVGSVVSCQRASSDGAGPAQPTPVKRGEYLVAALGCDDCHTTKTMTAQGPAPDMAHRLAGHLADPSLPAPPALPPGPWGIATTMNLTAWSGPWGISYAINLTPDEGTGLGIWTEEMFVNSIRTGKHMGQLRPVLPPMPWPSYAKLTDDDLKAMFAYLKSLPPIANQVPDPVIAPPPPPAP